MEMIYKTIGQMMDDVVYKYPRHEAVVHSEMGGRYSYSLLSWEVNRIARGLIALGLKKGDKAGICAPNLSEWIIAQLAMARLGVLMVPIDPALNTETFHYILSQSECKALVVAEGMEGEELVDTALYEKESIPGLEHLIVIADKTSPGSILWSEIAASGEEVDPRVLEEMEAQVHPDDPVAIMYTSGTTGKPKGVILDHLGLINKSVCSTSRQGITSEDRLCLFFPLYHMFGNTCIALAGLLAGATLVIPCRSFEPETILQSVFKEKCTAVYGSPSMIISLVDNPIFKKKRWSSVVRGIIGGAPCPMDVMKRLVEDLGMSEITVGYGITETSSWITMTHPDDPIEARVSTIGRPLPCNEVKIIDPHTGDDLPPGKQGELCTRGFLMKEYYKMPAATKEAIDREGWFHSGDLGEMDENQYVKITGRLKDMISRAGVEIHPAEVEDVLYRLSGVSEAQVFGFKHPEAGQEVAAWVKPKDGYDLSIDSLKTHVREYLPPEKVPTYFKIVSHFPMTKSGKVQKFKLAEMAEKEHLS